MRSKKYTVPYLTKIPLNDVYCFKGEQSIDLSNGKEEPAMMTVILGYNNAGKTSLLKHLANFSEETGFIVYGYGTSRRMVSCALADTESQATMVNCFESDATLINAEDWLLNLYISSKSDNETIAEKAQARWEKVKAVLTAGILPDVDDFRSMTMEIENKFINFISVKAKNGNWAKLRSLGYGYQTMFAWLIDFIKLQFRRYPDSENPLHEPAIVLLDEVDSHLHPSWQRQILTSLRTTFPKTQFIVTAHSPLVVQSQAEVNLIMLKKEEDRVILQQRNDLRDYRGWSIEEIDDQFPSFSSFPLTSKTF